MHGALVFVREDSTVHIRDISTRDAAQCSREVPVVDAGGSLAGVVSADDLLGFLAEELEELSRISPYQQAHERRARQ